MKWTLACVLKEEYPWQQLFEKAYFMNHNAEIQYLFYTALTRIKHPKNETIGFSYRKAKVIIPEASSHPHGI